MFDSGISAKELVDELISEADIALNIPTNTYLEWLNSLQQTLYTEIIREQKEYSYISNNTENEIPIPGIPVPITKIDLSTIPVVENESTPIFEDVYAVYMDNIQMMKSTLTSGTIFQYTYFKYNNNIGYNLGDGRHPRQLRIIYFVRPALVTENNIDEAKVMLPIEFIELAKAKLRGEAYKFANEDELAAKWLNDYNILLETFKVWISEKSPNFGL